jgi:uncharacterized protein (UPF0147 family)
MASVRIGARNAARVGGILQKISTGRSVPTDVRANATYWASAIHRTMDRRDLRAIARLLADMSADRSLSARNQHDAQYWAAYLEAQL